MHPTNAELSLDCICVLQLPSQLVNSSHRSGGQRQVEIKFSNFILTILLFEICIIYLKINDSVRPKSIRRAAAAVKPGGAKGPMTTSRVDR